MQIEQNGMDRRTFHKEALLGMAVGSLSLTAEATGAEPVLQAAASPVSSQQPARMPTIFLAHGNPTSIDDTAWMASLKDWATDIPKPRGILMISAHWVDRPITLGATRTIPLVYDFYGFPQRYYQIQYQAPGSAMLARRVKELLAGQEKVLDAPERGLDHGAYIPLMGMYPAADVPVLQMSIPTMNPEALLALGKKLAPLRQEGILIIGSGFLSHNLRALDRSSRPVVPTWAQEFDRWAEETLSQRDADALVRYRELAPGVRLALPTHEHFVPVLVTLGSSLETGREEVQFPITGFSAGTLTLRSVQYG